MEAAISIDEWFNHYERGVKSDFTLFYRACYNPLVFYANRLLNDVHMASELVGEVTMKVWECRHRWEGLAALKGFLFTSLRNACFNVMQHMRRRKRWHSTYLSTQGSLFDNNVHEEVYRHDLLRDLLLMANQLPAQAKRVFHLYYQDGLSHSQIALQLGLTESTIRNQKARALKILRLQLKKVKKL